MTRIGLAAAASLCLLGSAIAEERAFDVPGGEVRAIYSLEFSPDTAVKCRLTGPESNPSVLWEPSLSIILSETPDVLTRSDTLRFVQFQLGIDQDSGQHTYSLIVHLDGDSRRTNFLATDGDVPEVFLALGFRGDGTFNFRAREGDDMFADTHEFEPAVIPKYAIVAASGLAGTVVCGIGDG